MFIWKLEHIIILHLVLFWQPVLLQTALPPAHYPLQAQECEAQTRKMHLTQKLSLLQIQTHPGTDP